MLFRRGVVEKILERLEQERTKTAPLRVGVPEPITFQNHKKKILGEILGVFGGMAAPADEGEDWAPIQPAEFGERFPRFLIVAGEIGRGKDQTPARRREVARGATAFRGHTGIHDRR